MRKNVFDEGIITNTHFRSLSREAQLVYFHLSPDYMGIVANITATLDSLGLSRNDFNELVAKNFYMDLGDDVYLQKHWHINNNLDYRRLSTRFPEKLKNIFVKKNRAYTTDKNEQDWKLTQMFIAKPLMKRNIDSDDSIFEETDHAEITKIIKTEWINK